MAKSRPPPRHNFTELPRIRSERPAFELHYPHLVEQFRHEAHVGHQADPYQVVAQTTARESSPGGKVDPRER